MKEIMNVKWDTGLNLIAINERCFFYQQDLKQFIMKLTKNLNIPLSRCRVFFAKDGCLVWYPEDEVLKFLLDIVANAIAGFKSKLQDSSSFQYFINGLRNTGFKADDEDYLYFVKRKILLPLKRKQNIKASINEFIENLKMLHRVIEYEKELQDRFIQLGEEFLSGSIKLTPEQLYEFKALSDFEIQIYHIKEDFLRFIKNKKLTTEEFINSLIEYFEREVEGITAEDEEGLAFNKRVCINCLCEFIPQKGNKAIYCGNCYLTARHKIKKRIQRHNKRENIKKLIRELKNEFDLKSQKKLIKSLKSRYKEIFN